MNRARAQIQPESQLNSHLSGLNVVEQNYQPRESQAHIILTDQKETNNQGGQRKRQSKVHTKSMQDQPQMLNSQRPGQLNSGGITSQSQKMLVETNVIQNQQSQAAYPQSNISSDSNQSQDQLYYNDKYMIVVYIVGIAAYLGLGLFALKVSNPFQEIQIKYDQNEKVIVEGFFSVIIAFCITFVVGLLIKPIISKNFKLSLKLFIILSILILFALVGYSFGKHLTALGIAAAIAAFLIAIVGFIYYSRIEILSQVGEMSTYFNLLQLKYVLFVLAIIFILLLSVTFSMIVVTHILFISDANNQNQNAINFFAAIYVFLTYWVNNTVIQFYSFVISRQVSKVFFKKPTQQMNNLQTLNTNKTNRGTLTQVKNQELIGEKQNSLNSADSNQENNQLMHNQKKQTVIIVNSNLQTNNNNAEQLTNAQYEQRNYQNANLQQDFEVPLEPQIDADCLGEPLMVSIKIGLKQIGTLALCSLISQIVECLAFVVFVLIYGTGLVLFYSSTLNYFNESLIKINSYISIVRMAHDDVGYFDSLKLIGNQIVKRNYYYALAMYLSNQISQIIEFFCFAIGFVVGIVLIVTINYYYWFITFTYILLLFCVVKNASKISVAGISTVLFSVSTYFDLMAFDKILQQKSDKFQNIYLLLKNAKKLMKENEEEKQLEELY
ncbi:hypothetical protein ABPG74_013120 [Tetrahymena malaccensis]